MHGKIRINKRNSNIGTETIAIEVRDENSHAIILEISGSFDQMARAILGLVEADCTYELTNLDIAGKYRCTKVEIVALKKRSKRGISQALRPYEVNGWVARAVDFDNPHRYRGRDKAGNDLYEVLFVSFRDTPTQSRLTGPRP